MIPFQRALALISALLVIPSLLIASANSAEVKFDMDVPASYGLGPCKSLVEMECIESIEVRSEDSTFVKGKWTRIPTGKIERTDDQGNVFYENESEWETSEGIVKVSAYIDSFEKLPFGAVLRLHLKMDSDSSFGNRTFRVVVRESLLRPMNVQLLAVNSRASVESYEDGRRWTLEGKPRTISGYDSSKMNQKEITLSDGRKVMTGDVDWSLQADVESVEWNFYIHHAENREGRGYFPDLESCADKGFSITSFNAPSAGDPSWDKSSNSLNFAIAAPAYKVDGTRNEGFFYFSTTHEYLDCKFKENTFGPGTQLVLEVLAEDGTVKTATSSITNTGNSLEFFAAGFTYSSPTVKLRESKSASSTEVKKKILCVKGKVKKVLPAGQKQCPKGWKKKVG